MQINSVEYLDGVLSMRVLPCPELFNLLRKFKQGEYEIIKKRKKRSKNANDYCWELCEKIAEKVHLPRIEVYRQCIRDYGKTDILVAATRTAAEDMVAAWSAFGLGWQAEIFDFDNAGFRICVYYGSSSYNTQEMSMFIEGIKQECQQLGIETLSPEELEMLLRE